MRRTWGPRRHQLLMPVQDFKWCVIETKPDFPPYHPWTRPCTLA